MRIRDFKFLFFFQKFSHLSHLQGQVRKLKKKKEKFEITNSHWREIWRAFGLKRFRSKYYYLTKWTEKSTVYGNWQLVVWPWRWEKLKKKNKKFEITNSHWHEIWRAFGLKRFRSKYYYLTKWTEKSTVYGNWELVVWLWRWERWENFWKKNKNLKSRIRTGVKSGELLV